jgi:glycerol-3-phosphate dehydrogenase
VYDVAIIGCGIVGAAAARELSKYKLSVCILEKENDVSDGTTKANSAIIHSGYDPMPNTLMAELNVRGAALTKELARELDVTYDQIGSLTLAFDEEDVKTVHTLYERGIENKVPGIRILSAEEVRKMEPNLSKEVKCALFAPSAGVIMPWRLAIALAQSAVVNGAKLKLSCPVTGIEKTETGYVLHTPQGDVEAKNVINAAGIYADIIHDMVAPHRFTTHPSRGQYYLLDKSAGDTVHHVIFQCPTSLGKGVLVSPTMDGNLIVGPNAEQAERDDLATTAEGLEFVKKKAALSVPDIQFRDSIRNFSGLRAVTEIDDFIIEESEKGFFDAAGIKSPGLSSAPAIAEYLAELLQKSGVKLEMKENFLANPKKIEFKKLSPEEKRKAIKQNPLYGRIICRCETISEGEIVDALHAPIPPRTIDGVKRRCGAGLGRCQGGFCGPRVHDIIARELGMGMEDVMLDKESCVILTGETKAGGNCK